MSIEEDLCSQEALLKLDDIELQASYSSSKNTVDTVRTFYEENDTLRELTSIGGQKILFNLSLTGKLKSISVVINEDQIFVGKHDWSKELREISSLDIFDAYVKNTYIKVIELNDKTIKLKLEQRMLGGMLSIQTKADQYSHDNHTNANNEGFYPVTPRSTGEIINEIQKYQRNANGAITINHNSIDLPIVNRYSITTNNWVQDLTSYSTVLHPIEDGLFAQARNDLNNCISAVDFLSSNMNKSPQNVVLVDTFVRESNGIIKVSGGNPEFHTVVLWKKKDDEIVLIDPNNIKWTSWLGGVLHNALNCPNITTAPPSTTANIYVNSFASYKRDCIDIAVKIAFELNDLQCSGTPINNIVNEMIGNISNHYAALFGAGKLTSQFSNARWKNVLGNYYSNLNKDRISICSEALLKSEVRADFMQSI